MEDLRKLTDGEIVERVRSGDPELYREIMSRYQDKLMRYANYMARDEAESADIVQNAFIKAFVNLNSFDSGMKFSSWIYRIVHNEAMNSFAKHKNEVAMDEGMDFESSEDIEGEAVRKEDREMVEKCLAGMPVIYSEPLSLFFLEDKSYEEISDILRLPVGTVGTRISRAKNLMKKICRII